MIELGVPFSDPVADGPVIQDASYRAICGEMCIRDRVNSLVDASVDSRLTGKSLIFGAFLSFVNHVNQEIKEKVKPCIFFRNNKTQV